MNDPLAHILHTSVADGLASAAHASTVTVRRAIDAAKAQARARKSLITGLERELRKRRTPEYQAQLVDVFNGLHRVGTPLCVWPGDVRGESFEAKSRSEASLLSGHTAVVWVEGKPGCFALDNIEVKK